MAYVIVSFVVVTAITFVAGYLALRRTRLGVERFASATVTPAAGTILRFEPGSEGYWQRLMERLETDDEVLARHEIDVDDAARAARMGEAFNVGWFDPTLYDLTLNTERVPIATCVDQVIALVKSPAFQETPESRRHLENLALQARVRAALRADERTEGIDITIDAEGGRVRLSGIVVDEREKELCRVVVEKVRGVTEVRDELRTMAGNVGRFPQVTRRKDM